MNKKGKRGFKMKGFSPFTTESSSPMKNVMEGLELTEVQKRKKARKEAAIYRSPHRAEPSEQGGEHRSATGLDDFSASERKAILGSKSGINATIDRSLMRGMDPGSHEGRKHVGRINALRQFKEEMDGGQIRSRKEMLLV